MFPPEIRANPQWCLYDTMNGQTVLKYPWRKDREVPCPHCGKPLVFENYMATCCGESFGSSWGEIHQNRPVGTHAKRKGRGWESIRPYRPTQDGELPLGL